MRNFANYNFEAFDFSNNNIRKLNGFPMMLSIKSLYLANNKISSIDKQSLANLPNLECLILTNNLIRELSHLELLSFCKNLKILSIMNNPVTSKSLYRSYLIYKLPSLVYLDFKKIKQTERDYAKGVFESQKFKNIIEKISNVSSGSTSQLIVSDPTSGDPIINDNSKVKLSRDEIMDIKKRINSARSFEDIAKLNEMLKRKKLEG
ncbi:MAG: U2 small nuclear ribonucleoprotein A', variant 2 [Marteilia pararefringens]